MWNKALLDNPCDQPLVVVTLRAPNPPGIIQARMLKDLGGDKESIQIMTVQHGPLYVDRDQVQPWTPARCLDGINFEHLKAALLQMPMTWYPALLETIVRGAHTAGTFQPLGASGMALRLETELLPPESEFVATARARTKAADLKTVLTDLLNTTELNLDEMEQHTRDTIDRAVALIHEIETGK